VVRNPSRESVRKGRRQAGDKKTKKVAQESALSHSTFSSERVLYIVNAHRRKYCKWDDTQTPVRATIQINYKSDASRDHARNSIDSTWHETHCCTAACTAL